jgi:hypothetical protein
VRLVAKLNGGWVEIGPKVTQPTLPGAYDWDVDLCAAAPLNGPLEVALRVWDHEGNISPALSPRTIQVEHACPPPASQLTPAESFASTAVRLSWDAASAGAGLGAFDLQWRPEPGTWQAANIISMPGDSRSTWFVGEAGNTYAFRLRALDTNSQPEPWPANDAFETSAALPAACAEDGFEPDDNPSQAKILALGAPAQRNLCGAGDPDWFQVDLAGEANYYVLAPSLSGGAAARITVYAENETTILAIGQAAGIGQDASLRFHAAAGRHYLKIEPLIPTLMGTGAAYSLSVLEEKQVFLPLLRR